MFKKGHPRYGGIKKGTPRAQTILLKDMITTALSEAGGVEYLRRQAHLNPAAFLALVGKVLPLQITGANDQPLIIKLVNYGKEQVEESEPIMIEAKPNGHGKYK